MSGSEQVGCLVLARKINEGITITLPDGRRIHIEKISERHGSTRLKISAPKDVRILRDEIQEMMDLDAWGAEGGRA